MKMIERVCAVVVAAGESRRMEGIDKIMADLNGKPVLAWSIEALQESPEIERIIIVNNQRNLETVRRLVIEQKWHKVTGVCPGGPRRQDSVAAGLALTSDCEWILIHDGARPLLTEEMIKNGIEAARETGAAVAAVPVTDTIKVADKDLLVKDTPPRSRLWAAQTPQVFRSDIIKEAYKQVRGEVTDDASLVEQAGFRVKLYPGSYQNLKITSRHDLEIASQLLRKGFKNDQ